MPTRAVPMFKARQSRPPRRVAPTSSAGACRSGGPHSRCAQLCGGLMSPRCPNPLLSPTPGEAGLGSDGVAGLMLAPGVPVATALTQGCVPIGPVHRIDEARDNVGMAVDGRPAVAVFCEDIGPALAADLRRVGGLIFAGLPVAGSDT